jgi:sulfate adenylyltransferase
MVVKVSFVACSKAQNSKLKLKKLKALKKLDISGRAKGDLIMMGIGGFSPLNGFMGKKRLEERM